MCHLVARGTITTLAILGIGCAPDTPAPAQQAESLERREARYIEPVPWDKEHITKAIGLGYPELGMEMDVAHSEMRTIDGRSCVVGNMVSFDVDDDYAFDIDEPVSVTLTYAPEHTSATSFQVIWDRNGGDGHGRLVVDVEPGATFRETTVTLDRARLAGLGAQRTDFAVGVSRAAVALCDVSIERSGTTSPAAQFGTVLTRHVGPHRFTLVLAEGDFAALFRWRQKNAPTVFRHPHMTVMGPALGIDADGGAQIDLEVAGLDRPQIVPPLQISRLPAFERAQ